MKILHRKFSSVFNENDSKGVDEPQSVTGDTNESFRAQFSGETPGVIESVENERSELEHVLMAVVEPRSTGESEDSGGVVDGHSSELYRSRSKESAKKSTSVAWREIARGSLPSSCISELTTQRIQHRS